MFAGSLFLARMALYDKCRSTNPLGVPSIRLCSPASMNDPVTPANDPARFLPILMLLFAGSGCSALIYEIVWYQLLQLAIGSTTVSLGVLLATFMGGLALGSWLLPRVAREDGPNARNPLAVYGAIEAGIAVFGLIELFLIPMVIRVYVAGAQFGMPGMLLRGV